MKVKLITIGKTNASYLKEGIAEYEKRLKHYVSFEMIEIPDLKKTKNLTSEQIKAKEGELLLKHLSGSEHIVLLDENGKEYNSIGFSKLIQKRSNSGLKHLVFIIGGPYGFSDEIYKRAKEKLALSQLTFSHQMVRLFFVEQLYRSFTILKGEPYHHQ